MDGRPRSGVFSGAPCAVGGWLKVERKIRWGEVVERGSGPGLGVWSYGCGVFAWRWECQGRDFGGGIKTFFFGWL